ncbi:MAG: glycosyltransferase, partial [Solirubrobacteraceae bacterium]
ALERAGASAAIADAGPVAQVRTFMLTDLVQARSARRAAEREIEAHAPAAVVYCSVTAALLWPRPGAIWLDVTAAENRPGRHGVWQRAVERRRLACAPLLLTMAGTSLDAHDGRARGPAVVVPVPVASSGSEVAGSAAGWEGAGSATGAGSVRDIDVLAYTGDPVKRRLDLILEAWARARRGTETLVVAGLERPPGVTPPPGVTFAGRLPPDAYRTLVRRARVFVAAPRREDFGIAQLEALADGAMLVTTPAPGPYAALPIARQLDPRLVGDDLVSGLRAALDDPVPGYARRAAELIAPFSPEAVAATLSQHVLPRLLPGWRA